MIEIQPASLKQIDRVLEIERAACELFRPWNDVYQLFVSIPSVPDGYVQSVRHGMLWVAVENGDVVGFAQCVPIRPWLHLDELDIDPRVSRRGIGRRLVEHVVQVAKQNEFAGVSLITLREVPFNAPYYARMGFVEMPEEEFPEGIRRKRANEKARGLDTQRVVMKRINDHA